MRHRPSGAVRVVGVCARCGFTPDLYAVRHVRVALETPAGARPHELVVCRTCDDRYQALATPMERAALAVDTADPVQVMAFVQAHGADPARVQRTAAHFLGPAVYAAERAAAVASGPGTFAAAWLDALDAVTAEDVAGADLR